MGSGAQTTSFEAFGVRLRVRADSEAVLERIPALLPPGARSCPGSPVEESFDLLADDDGTYRLERGDAPVANRLDLELALMLLDEHLRTYVGLHAEHSIFVQAGVVGYQGRAIVIPGRSMAGKTTLVRELVRAGAVYYSDECAVLDEQGLVHPYPTAPASRESAPGAGPLRIGAVVLTAYRPGAHWQPTRGSPGRGVTALLAHSPAATTRSGQAMQVISRAVAGAAVLEGERGEASELVAPLLSPRPEAVRR